MLKRLFRKSFFNISFVGIGTVLNATLGFFYLSSVAKTLPIEEFGKYALLASLLVSLSKLLDFGTNSIFVAKSITTRDETLNTKFISSKIAQFFIAVPISLVIIVFFKLNSPFLLAIFVLGLLFYGLNYTLFGFFQKKEKYGMLVLLNALPAITKGIFAFLLLLGAVNASLPRLFAIFALSIGTSSLLLFFVEKESFKIDFSEVKNVFKETFSPGLSQLITEGFPAVSNSLAKFFSGFSNVGIFSLADKISSAFVLVSYSVFTVLLPKNAARKRDAKGYDYQETSILAVGVLLLSVGAIFLARLFIPWFFQGKYDQSLELINLLVFSGAFSSIHAFMENYFYVERKTNYLAFFSGGKLTTLILLAIFLIPKFSIRGLAIAHLLASFLTAGVVCYFVFFKREKKKNILNLFKD